MTLQLASTAASDAPTTPRPAAPRFDPYHPFRRTLLSPEQVRTLSAYLGDNLRSFVEHSHPESDAKADEHRLVTHISNRVERLFVAPMNMNYHAAHHLWVGIPYYNLPEADRLMREHPGSSALEWRRSYLGYLWRYVRALPLEECKA